MTHARLGQCRAPRATYVARMSSAPTAEERAAVANANSRGRPYTILPHKAAKTMDWIILHGRGVAVNIRISSTQIASVGEDTTLGQARVIMSYQGVCFLAIIAWILVCMAGTMVCAAYFS
jgi:hypothetical protein